MSDLRRLATVDERLAIDGAVGVVRMAEQNQVREFFNRKAGGWHRKYALSGPLAHRLSLFEAELRRTRPPPASVLELGCGTGNLAVHLAEQSYTVTACDIAEVMLTTAREAFPTAPVRWQLLEPGRTRLPFDGGTFDAVIASSVFEYLDDVEQSLAECARVVKASGVVVFSVPNPVHPVRRVEEALRPLAVRLHEAALPWPERVQSVLKYMTYSRNRFPLARWEALAWRAGLERLPAQESASAAMVLLAFRPRRASTADMSEGGR